jgi:hypothetical protein
MGEIITLENFGPNNRTKRIGNSMYRICRENDNFGKWYIHETYNDGCEWTGANGFSSDDLISVIDAFNAISTEKELVNAKRRQLDL